MGKPLTGETGKGINGSNRGKLLVRCEHCKCQRYKPCQCAGAVKARNSKEVAA